MFFTKLKTNTPLDFILNLTHPYKIDCDIVLKLDPTDRTRNRWIDQV